MQIVFTCPACSNGARRELAAGANVLECGECSWSRAINEADVKAGVPGRCLACGCDDLWRQKDFPQTLGLGIVALGAALSTIAMAYYYPATALGILLTFALADLVVYAIMPDVLVCYRCHARHRHTTPGDAHAGFNLETAERYRQESKRLDELRATPGVRPT